MSRKQLTIYSNREFKKANRLDRIYMSMVEERFESLLSYEEEAHANKLQQAYAHLYKEVRRSAAVKWIQKNIEGAQTYYLANRVFDDMQELYGRFVDKNKQLKQAIVVERMYEQADRLMKMSEKLEKQKKYDEAGYQAERAAKILEMAAKIDGLDKVKTGFSPQDFEIPEIVISSDPRILRIGEEAEEVEEVPGEGG